MEVWFVGNEFLKPCVNRKTARVLALQLADDHMLDWEGSRIEEDQKYNTVYVLCNVSTVVGVFRYYPINVLE